MLNVFQERAVFFFMMNIFKIQVRSPYPHLSIDPWFDVGMASNSTEALTRLSAARRSNPGKIFRIKESVR
jgi:hypothetical protein